MNDRFALVAASCDLAKCLVDLCQRKALLIDSNDQLPGIGQQHNEDLLKENIDVAIRIGVVKSEGLVAASLGTSTRRVFAAPSYLDRHGLPDEPADLANHNCIAFTLLEHDDRWHFTRGAQALDVAIRGNVTSNSSEAIREMVLGGLGMSLSPQWLFAADVQQGIVRSVLDDYQTTALPVSAVFGRERRRSARTMAFVDFLREHL